MDTLTEAVEVDDVLQVVPNRADWRKRGHRDSRYRMPRTAARRTGQPTAWRTVEVDDKARQARKRLAVGGLGAIIDEAVNLRGGQ